jgi:DnaJ family protein C protein 9
VSGSSEEIDDLRTAYITTQGSIAEMMTYIPHSTHDDEARFITTISGLIAKGDLSAFATWESSTKDEKARVNRKKQGEKEAKEAEKLARELGVWDEFYGSGETGQRKGKGKEKRKKQAHDAGGPEDEEDHSALQALILKKRQKNMDGFFDSLAAKYADTESGPKSRSKGKKRARDGEDVDSKKKARTSESMPEIDDEEFDALQKKLFGQETVHSDPPVSKKVQKGAGRRKVK